MIKNLCRFELPKGEREKKRLALISHFLSEKAGTGTGDNASRYQYNVETYDKYGIFLKRPTRLNKGFDFTVNIEGLYFKKTKRYSNPSHQDIFNALTYCKDLYPLEYEIVKKSINDIYNCSDNDIPNIDAYFIDYEGNLHPIQILLLAIKWLFMEQDCAYWNYSGRKMLYEELNKRTLL